MLNENYKDFAIAAGIDVDAPNPLIDQDASLGTIALFHPDYEIGHRTPYQTLPELHVSINSLHMFSLPIYLVKNHDRLSITTYPARGSKNVEQIGYIYVAPDKIRANLETQRIGTRIKNIALDILAKEVATYNAYLCKSLCAFEVSEGGKVINRETGFLTVQEAMLAAKHYVNSITSVKRNKHVEAIGEAVKEAMEYKKTMFA